MIFGRWGKPNIDLFASIHNHKLTVFCSRLPCPVALSRDAFSISWSSFPSGYAFPPIVLLDKVLKKVHMDQARLLLVAPFWPNRCWYLGILHNLVDLPLMISPWPDLLSQFRVNHPDPNHLKLVAWRISGVSSESRAFRRKLLTPSRELGLSLP